MLLIVVHSKELAELINRGMLPRMKLPNVQDLVNAPMERETLPNPAAVAIATGEPVHVLGGWRFDAALIGEDCRRFWGRSTFHEWWTRGPMLRLKANAPVVDLSGQGLKNWND